MTDEFTCVVPPGWECDFTNTAAMGGFLIGFAIFLVVCFALLAIIVSRGGSR